MKTFNWAVVGPGRIAHRFAEAVNRTDDTAISWVIGRDLERASTFGEQYSRAGYAPARSTINLAEALAADDIDCVYIASPHAFHAEAIRQCLQAKKAVLCEKPLVTDATTARELERVKGIEPSYAAWEAAVLPLNYTRANRYFLEEGA